MGEPMKNYAEFRSDLPDEPKWDGMRLLEPAGHAHIQLLAGGLSRVGDVTEPWNEEDYAWELVCKVGGISVSVLIEITSHDLACFLVIIHPVVLFKFLRRRRMEEAISKVCEEVGRFLREDARVHDVRWFTRDEYEACADAKVRKQRDPRR
jgi:hypothetical protein